jgi:hypothetical protein
MLLWSGKVSRLFSIKGQLFFLSSMNYPAAEQRGIKNSIAHAKLRRRAAGNKTLDPDRPKSLAVGM